jgi:hypothetical protein
MSFQFSDSVRNARLDVVETTVGTAPVLQFRTGAQPVNCAAASSGTVIATLTLPSDWMSAASGGVKSLLGTWQDLSADATGVIGHFRVFDSGLTTCHMQGDCTNTGGGGDVQLQNVNVNAGQPITVTSFTLTEGNA